MALGTGRVLVLGTSFRAGPWTCVSLRRAGYAVLGAEVADPLAGRTLRMPAPLRCPDPSGDPDGLAEWIVATCRARDVGCVLSTDEDMTRVLAGIDPLPDGLRRAGPDAAQYAALCDKAALHVTAAAAGVASPRAAVVTRAGTEGALPDAPCAVKPRISGEGRDVAVVRAETAADRDAAVRRLLEAGNEAVVEAWQPGRQVVVYAVRDAHGGIAALSARVVDRHPRAAGTPSVMVTSHEPACAAALDALLAEVGYRGPANAQFIVGPDGAPVVHDVNLRVGAAVAMAVRAGLDVPVLGVRAAAGARVAPARYRSGLVYVALGSEIAAVRDDIPADPGAAIGTARRVVRAALSGAVVDPPPWEPFPVAAAALSGARRLARAGGLRRRPAPRRGAG